MIEQGKLDPKTKEWLDKQPEWYATTVRECPNCGLWYKPSFGHKCEVSK